MQEFIDKVALALQEWWVEIALAEKAPQVLIALLILLLGTYIARLIKGLVERGLAHRRADAELSLLLGRIVQWSLVGAVVLFAADQIGLDITAFLTGLGILGFTVGFALQDVSKNFVAGILILIQQPFDLGDTIEVGSFQGDVLNINLRDTEIRTLEGLRVLIPNGDVFTSPIVNYSKTDRRRVELKTGVAYDSDLNKVRQVAVDAIKSIDGVLSEPEIDFRFDNFGSSAVEFTIFYWHDEGRIGYGQAVDKGVEHLKEAFDEAGIVMPGREQTIFVRNLDSGE